jgi:hypothetical protein
MLTLSPSRNATDNAAARAAVQAVAAQRRLLVQPGRRSRNVTQRIRYVAWDHADWYHQMVTAHVQQPGVMDHVCGANGYQAQYEDAVHQLERASTSGNDNDQQQQQRRRIAEWAASTLVTACLMRTGNGDGYVARTLHVASPMAWGVSGVAAVILNSNRIHDDVLWLPILSRQELLNRGSTPPPEPSTRLPHQMPEVLLSILRNATLHSWIHTRVVTQWQEFLYTAIVAENQQAAAKGQSRLPWKLLTAACRADDRARLARKQRLIATNCLGPSSNTTNTLHLLGGADYNGPNQECCAFLIPSASHLCCGRSTCRSIGKMAQAPVRQLRFAFDFLRLLLLTMAHSRAVAIVSNRMTA